MSGTQIKDFTQGNISKQFFTFAWPLFLSNLLQVVYNMVDMIVVGKVLGKAGLSAVAVGGDVSHFLTFISMGFASAGQVIIARYIGAGQRNKIGTFVGTMSSFLLVCAIGLSCAGLVFQDTILHLMNTPAEAYAGALSYSTISMIGLVFIYGYNTVSAIMRGMGDSKHPFVFISIAAVLNLFLDLVFVVGFHLGAGGAALATVISQGVSFISCVMFLCKNHEQFELNVKKQDFLIWDQKMLGELVRLGTPMAIKSASIQTSKLFVNSWINSYGVAVSAFAGIAQKVANISNLISNAMNTAGATMVGQNIAAGEFERVKKILFVIAKITLTIAAGMSFILWLFPEQIFGLFTEPGDIEVLALQGLDLTVEKGELVAIIGNSGSGKSTFLNMIGGLDKPSAGKLFVDGKNLFTLSEKELVEYKRDTVGFVWHNNARNLLP